MAGKRSQGPKLDANDFEAVSSTESLNPNKVTPKLITDSDASEYLKNPKLKKTASLACEADQNPHGNATHFFTPQGGDEVALCKKHLDKAVTYSIINNKNIKQRPVTSSDVEPHAQKRRLEMHAQRSAAEAGFRAAGLTGDDALAFRNKQTLGGGRRSHGKDPVAPRSGKELAASAREGVHPAEEVLSAVEQDGGHNVNILRDLNILNAQKNKIEQPSRYSAKGRIYDLSNKNKTKAPSNLEDMPSLEEMRAENHKRRSEAAKAAPGPTRFKPGSNKNPGRAKIGIGMPAKTEPEVDPLEAGLNVIDKLKTEKQLKGISESTEAERLRHIERLKTDPEYLKAHLQTARKNAQNKSAPPFTT